MSVAVEGTVSAGFEPVAAAFREAFDGEPDMGAALAIVRRGRPVVDLWGGVADVRTGRRWERDTLSVIFSCSKGLMSILAARLVQAGKLDYDALVTTYWPEFGEAGKGGTRVADLLSHRAGLPAPREPIPRGALADWDRIVAQLARQEPLWPPGTAYAYHPITHGWLIGEVVRRVTGLSAGEAFRRYVAEPAGAECWIGLPPAHLPRVARMAVGPSLVALTALQEAEARAAGGTDWPGIAMTLGGALPRELVGPRGHARDEVGSDVGAVADGEGFNDPAVQVAEVPGAGGIASARALATIWSSTFSEASAGHGPLLSEETVRQATAVRSEGEPFFPTPPPWPRWGAGFQLDSAARRYVTPTGFGHDGAGGQVAFADPAAGIGFAFLTNRMEAGDDRRATRIVDALRRIVTGTVVDTMPGIPHDEGAKSI